MSEESGSSTEQPVLKRSFGYRFPKSLIIDDGGEHPVTPYEVSHDDCRSLCKLMQDQIDRLVDEMPAKDSKAKPIVVLYKPHPELKISFLDRSHPNAKKSGWPSFITPRSLEEMHEMVGEVSTAFKDKYPDPETFFGGSVTHSGIAPDWIYSLYETLSYLLLKMRRSEYLQNWMEGSIENRLWLRDNWESHMEHGYRPFSPGLGWQTERLFTAPTSGFLEGLIFDRVPAKEPEDEKSKAWRRFHRTKPTPKRTLLHSELIAGFALLNRLMRSDVRHSSTSTTFPLRVLIASESHREVRVVEANLVGPNHICFCLHFHEEVPEVAWPADTWLRLLGILLGRPTKAE